MITLMTRLEKFSFYIPTRLPNKDIELKLPNRNNLRKSFLQFGYKDIDALDYITYLNHKANAPIYSLPYQLKTFDLMTSAFQDGKFD